MPVLSHYDGTPWSHKQVCKKATKHGENPTIACATDRVNHTTRGTLETRTNYISLQALNQAQVSYGGEGHFRNLFQSKAVEAASLEENN